MSKKIKLTELEKADIPFLVRNAEPKAKEIVCKRLGFDTRENFSYEVNEIFKIELTLRTGSKTEVWKAGADLTKNEALEKVNSLATEIHKEAPELSFEKALVKAVDLVPALGSLAIGHPLELVIGRG